MLLSPISNAGIQFSILKDCLIVFDTFNALVNSSRLMNPSPSVSKTLKALLSSASLSDFSFSQTCSLNISEVSKSVIGHLSDLIYLLIFFIRDKNSLNTIFPSLLPSTAEIICLEIAYYFFYKDFYIKLTLCLLLSNCNL